MISEANLNSRMTFLTRKLAKILILFSVFVVASCTDNSAQIYQLSGPIMGTTYHIKIISPPNPAVLEQIESRVVKAMTEVDSLMSTYKITSEVSVFNGLTSNQWFNVNPLTFEVVNTANQISRMTSGAFDITVSPLVNAWGFGPDGKPVKKPTEQAVKKILERIGFSNIVLDEANLRIMKTQPVEIDLSAIAKGFAVDRVALELERQGLDDYLVEIGGEIRASGSKLEDAPWILAIESPEVNQRKIWKKITIGNNALATSGDYRNYFEEGGIRYSHTIDPETGYPVQHQLTSVTVLSPSSAEADALATALLVLGEGKGYDLAVKHQIPAYFIYRSENGFSSKYTKEFNQYLIN